jgi:hypothetical protein
MTAESIISNAKTLTTNNFSSLNPTIPDGFTAAPNFSSPLISMPGGGATANVGYDGAATYPGLTLNGAPSAAAYAGVTTAVNFAATKLNKPKMEKPDAWPTVPTPGFIQPPLAYPTATYVDVEFDPGLQGITMPGIVIGARSVLLTIDDDTYDMADIEPMEFELPEYEVPIGSIVTAPAQPLYNGDASFISAVKIVFTMGHTLPTTAQDDMLNDKIGDLNRTMYRKEQKVVSEAAKKGFFMPTGMVNVELLAHAYDAHEEREKINREVTDEVKRRADAAFEQAANSSLSLQEKHMALVLAYAQALVKTQRYNVQMAALVLTTVVALFNAKVSALRIFIDNYKEYVQAIREQNSTIASSVKIAQAQAETDVADVSQYRAQIGTAKAIARGKSVVAETQLLEVDAYTSYVHAELSNMSIARANIESFKEAVQAFSRAGEQNMWQIDADLAALDAWGSEHSVINADAGVLVSYAKGRAANASTHSQYVQDVMRVLSAQVQEYDAFTRAQREYFSALIAKAESGARAIDGYQSIVQAAMGYTGDWNQAEAASKSAFNHLALAAAEQTTRQSALYAQNIAAQARIDAGRLAARANAAAGSAQAAYGVTSSSIRVAGTVGVSSSSRRGGGDSWDNSFSRSYGAHETVRASPTP